MESGHCLRDQASRTMPPVRQGTSRRSPSTRSSRSVPSSRLDNMRTSIQQLFSGRSSVGRPQSPESPKTPRPALGLQDLPSTRLVIPYLTRSASDSSRSAHSPTSSSPRSPDTPISSRAITPNALRQQTEYNISAIPPQVRRNSTRRFVGVDPAEQHLAQLAQDGRRRRQKSRKQSRKCGPKVKNPKIRSKIISCLISGMVRYLSKFYPYVC